MSRVVLEIERTCTSLLGGMPCRSLDPNHFKKGTTNGWRKPSIPQPVRHRPWPGRSYNDAGALLRSPAREGPTESGRPQASVYESTRDQSRGRSAPSRALVHLHGEGQGLACRNQKDLHRKRSTDLSALSLCKCYERNGG